MRTIAELYGINYADYFAKVMKLDEMCKKWRDKIIPVVNNELYVGIEIEVEKVKAFNDPFLVWIYKADGSLRNNGLEWISYPIKGDCISAALLEFYSLLTKTHHFSPRTSLHFHFDVRHLNVDQLTSVVLTYLSVESLLYKFVGGDRDKSVFCVPLYQTDMVNELVNYLRMKFREHRTGEYRYAGLNLDAVKKFGTIEFRHLGGTSDVSRIMTWINLLMCVYNYGLKNNLKSLIEEISQLNTNSFYIAYLNNVFGSHIVNLDLTDVKLDLEKGVKAVKQSTISNKFFKSLKEKITDDAPIFKYYKSRKLKFKIPIEEPRLDPDIVAEMERQQTEAQRAQRQMGGHNLFLRGRF